MEKVHLQHGQSCTSYWNQSVKESESRKNFDMRFKGRRRIIKVNWGYGVSKLGGRRLNNTNSCFSHCFNDLFPSKLDGIAIAEGRHRLGWMLSEHQFHHICM